jgi:uncharacterized membrane protein/tetratricopeptide (TPR) repeat protein
VSATSDKTNHTRFTSFGLLLVALCVLGTALRLFWLDANSLWVDEIRTVTTSQLDLLSIPQFQAQFSTHPPLLYVVTKVFILLAGTSEFVARMPAVLFGALSVLLTYKMGSMLWSRNTGLIAACLLALNPYHMRYSQEARHYSLVVFLLLLSVIFLLRALETGKRTMWLAFALTTSLAIYTHYYAFLALPSQVLFAACVIFGNWRSHRRRSVNEGPAETAHPGGRPQCGNGGGPAHGLTSPQASPSAVRQAVGLVASLTLIVLSYTPWLPVMKQQIGGPQIEFEVMDVGTARNVGLSAESLYQVLTAYSGTDGLALLLFVAFFVLGLVSISRQQTMLIASWIVLPFLFTLAASTIHSFDARYALYVLPMYLLVIAKGVGTMAQAVQRWAKGTNGQVAWPLRLTTALTLLALVLPEIGTTRDNYLRQKEDWRGAGEYLRQHVKPGEVIIADGQGYHGGADAGRVAKGLDYYLVPEQHGVTILPAERGLVFRLPESTTGVWGVMWHNEELSYHDLAGEGVLLVEFPQVAIVRLLNPQGSALKEAMTTLKALDVLHPRVEGRFDVHLALAQLQNEEGNLLDAQFEADLASQVAEEYQSLAAADPSYASPQWDWNPYWDLGNTYYELGMWERAVSAYEKVVAINPRVWSAYVRLANSHLELNQPSLALASYDRALAVEPDNADLCLARGEMYQILGRTDDARDEYQRALILDPQNEKAQSRLNLLSAPPEGIEYPINRSAGLRLALIGYDSPQLSLKPGDTLQARLWWQAVAAIDEDYTVFLHAVDASGEVRAQADALLRDGERGTSDWRLGKIVSQNVELRLAPSTPPGSYLLKVGLYDWRTGDRLPVWDEAGMRVTDDAITLTSIVVAE